MAKKKLIANKDFLAKCQAYNEHTQEENLQMVKRLLK